ncbi:signal-induced proliferation-associated 1-like protein 1, partial [Oncorhynchus nerka]|uniref:signal-induced proliferation-associated 1-like protein 1 n=1 Tax=Oncorhynchus nerka TaxID=8023 RepID=UPI0031B87C7B
SPVPKSGPGYSGAPRIQRQEQVIHHSPKKSSQVFQITADEGEEMRDEDITDLKTFSLVQPEGPYSSSNTLSSTASSGGHSDTDKWSDLGGPGAPGEATDSEPNGLGGGYRHGASADSGIDTSSYGGGLQRPFWPQFPREDSSATSPCSQTSVSPSPKTFYPRQGATSKYLIGWRKPGSTINSVDFGDNRRKSPGEGGGSGGEGGGGQGGVGVQSRPHHSPQPHLTHAKTSAEDDMKILSPDSPLKHRRHKAKDKSSSGQPPTRRSLHRTLSDESIYRGQRVPSLRLGDLEPDPSLASDVLFSCSTLPRSPTTRGVPLRRPSYKLGIKLHGDLSASDTSLAEMVERQRHPLPQELMPLPPSESRDSPLDWTHLVDVASTFEIQRGFVFSDSNPRGSGASSPHQSQPSLEIQLGPLSRPSSSEGPAGLERKLTKLEAMVRMLQDDLKKEREEKQRLHLQIKMLWEDNQRLQEESQSSAAKLKKFTEWVFNTIDMN